uniref:Uncharacterized protein n=1 Tax=Rhizophora mucronata TaxID=61149 RepID=A0A2P2NCE2_RHIMU
MTLTQASYTILFIRLGITSTSKWDAIISCHISICGSKFKQ